MFVAPIMKFHRRRRCEKGSRGARRARAGLQAQRYRPASTTLARRPRNGLRLRASRRIGRAA
eukprot:6178761-Pleurochrysis_carterae.AAC.2